MSPAGVRAPTLPAPARVATTDPTMALARRVIARAAGRERVEVGELVWADVDMAMIQDSGGPRRIEPALDRLGRGVWDPGRLVVVSDHYVPGSDVGAAAILQTTRAFASRFGVGRFHEGEGISHTLMVERAYVHPGMLYVGGDSHSCTAGALGCLAVGMGSTDMLGIVATGRTWLRVPSTIRVELRGEMPDLVSAKDVMLALIGEHGMDGARYQVVEFAGPAVTAMAMEERSVLTNMSAELGAKAGVVVADERTWRYLDERGVRPLAGYEWEGGADYGAVWVLDVDRLQPLVACPHRVDNVSPASELASTRINRAYIGACTGAKHADLVAAARVLAGRTVAPGVRLHVAPASRAALQQAIADGTAATLMAAGADILSTGCGACPGMGNGVLGDAEVCISSTNRNFRGRMGSMGADVYLASPATVAASAVAGHICDPRHVGTDR